MKIKVKTDESRMKFNIPVPISLVFSRFGLSFLKRHDDGDSFSSLDPKVMRKICKDIRKICKKHKGLNLIEVDTDDGTSVRITL